MIEEWAEPGSFAERVMKEAMELGFKFKEKIYSGNDSFILMKWACLEQSTYGDINILVRYVDYHSSKTDGLRKRAKLQLSRYPEYRITDEGKVTLKVDKKRTKTAIDEKNWERLKTQIKKHQRFFDIDPGSDEALIYYFLQGKPSKNGDILIKDPHNFYLFCQKLGFSYIKDPSLIKKMALHSSVPDYAGSNRYLYLPVVNGEVMCPKGARLDKLTVFEAEYAGTKPVDFSKGSLPISNINQLSIQNVWPDWAQVASLCPKLKEISVRTFAKSGGPCGKELSDLGVVYNTINVGIYMGGDHQEIDNISNLYMRGLSCETLNIRTGLHTRDWEEAAKKGQVSLNNFPKCKKLNFEGDTFKNHRTQKDGTEFLGILKAMDGINPEEIRDLEGGITDLSGLF